MPVVIGVGDAAVDLRGGEDQAAALAQRHDLVHRHDVLGGHLAGLYHREPGGQTTRTKPSWHSYTESANADLRIPLREGAHLRGHAEDDRRPADEPARPGAPVERVFHPVAVHFKGKGFYNTDYGTKRRNRELRESAESGADKYEAKQAEKKAEQGRDTA